MAPQPYLVNGRLTLQITVAALTHKMRVPCRIVLPATAPTSLVLFPSGGAPSVPTTTAAASWWNTIFPFYHSDVTGTNWLLEQNFGGSFIPVDSGTLAIPGNNPAFNQSASSITYTFKTTGNHKLKILLMESVIQPFHHVSLPTGNVSEDALINFVAENTGAPNGNAWMTSRGGEQISRFTTATGSLNKRFKRIRHVE